MKILVTAGPTREPIDPVRFLSNRSTGKMGYAVAAAAKGHGHNVKLISGPVSLTAPDDVNLISVTTAAEMLQAVESEFSDCDALIMCAAVADWRPRVVAESKLKKDKMAATLELERTPDILERVASLKQGQIVVGFAAETENLLEQAQRKLAAKRLDMIVANDVSRPDAGFAVDTNAVLLVTASEVHELPLMRKEDVAEKLIEAVELLAASL